MLAGQARSSGEGGPAIRPPHTPPRSRLALLAMIGGGESFSRGGEEGDGKVPALAGGKAPAQRTGLRGTRHTALACPLAAARRGEGGPCCAPAKSGTPAGYTAVSAMVTSLSQI